MVNKSVSSVAGKVSAIQGTLKTVSKLVVSINERMVIKHDLRDYATKGDLERMKEDLLSEIRPIGKAVDKDAVTIIDHERRITRLEQPASR